MFEYAINSFYISSDHPLSFIHSGDIECVCTTKECKENGKQICMAESVCYVQHLPVESHSGHTDNIIRGCIESKTPILCENRRPQNIGGPWPALHCCSENNCNSDVVPTIELTWNSGEMEAICMG